MIEVYSNGCPNCNTLKGILDDAGIDYKPHNITTDKLMEVAREYNVQSAPIVIKDGGVVFARNMIDYVELLEE